MDNFDLGETLFKYRNDHRMSQQQMGDMLGMSRQAYDRLEKGYRKPTYEEVQRILKAIGRSIPSAEVAVLPPSSGTWNIYNLKHRLLYGTIRIDDALVRMKDLAKAVDCPVLLDWSHYELKGYFAGDEKPLYRLYGRTVEVDYKNGSAKIFKFPIPFESIDPGLRYPNLFVYSEGIQSLEDLLAQGDGKGFESGNDLKAQIHSILQEIHGPNIEVKGVTFVTSTLFMRKVLMAIEEIMLTFLLDLERKFGREAELRDLRLCEQLITDMFIKARNLTGDASHLDLPAKPQPPEDIVLAEDDLDMFFFWLEEHELMETDDLIDDFLDLLDEQEKMPPPPGIVPPKVYGWVDKVIAENSNFGPNGEKLIDALKIYYGAKH
jgi:transcriptional regulator with XRE-family HTH domain